MMVYRCKCGTAFHKLTMLRQHIGICNPRWPRKSEDDEHDQVVKRPELWEGFPVEDHE